MSRYDLDNLLLYLHEIAKLGDILRRKGRVLILHKQSLDDTAREILRTDLERACGAKVSITRSNIPSNRPDTHPHVYLAKTLDEAAEVEADHEDLLLLQQADSR